ncbi:MAG: ComEC/Rec2 family competence protein [Candidatus Levybacteria bacterium]|nr:ComEC/Rec2 family competence protein [Candidatus Levybacteria bacterium]
MRSRSLLFIILLTIILSTRLFFYYDSDQEYEVGREFKKTYSFMHEPKRNEISQYFFVDGLFISIPLYPRYTYGDIVDISGRIDKRTTEKGELLTIENPTISKVVSNNPFLFITKFVRERIGEAVMKALPQKEAGLLLGIILGVRDKIDNEFYKELRSAGVLHVVAASGQNVSILAALLIVSLQKVVKRKIAILFTGIGILFYSVLTGFDPPIVRASVMAIISFGAVALGRQTSGLLALLLTGWGMVLISPGLLEDVSFQLSFLATCGIMMIKPILDRIKIPERITLFRDDVTTTISAQIATFPLILGVFGTYSLLSLPINILILWTVPIIMIFGGIGALLSMVSPYLSLPFIYLSYPFLKYFSVIIDISSHFDNAVGVESLPQALIFGYYLIIFGIVLGLTRHERREN